MGSLSPEGSSIGIGVGVGSVYANGRVDRRRERAIPARRLNEGPGPDEVARKTRPDTATDDDVSTSRSQSASSLSSSSTVSSSATLKPKPESVPTVSTTTNVPDYAKVNPRLKPPHSPLAVKPYAFPHPTSPLEASFVSVAEARGKMSRDAIGSHEGSAAALPSLRAEGGTFVGKAVDVAGALLEAIWHS